MKKQGPILNLLAVFSLVCIVILSQNCKQKSATESKATTMAALEINVQEIKDSTGIQFNISKTEDIGYKPLHKFYWVSLEHKINQEKIEKLAQKIIQSTIARIPNAYHSFTIHFTCDDKNAESGDQSIAFAKATFLPEGEWAQIGRAPINDYADYKLTCTIKDNMLK